MNVCDTERVICEVRQRPVLWDLCNNLYKDRDARVKSWIEIYEALYPEYNVMEDTRKKEIEKLVQQRWKTARDAYMRCKNLQKNTASGSGGSKKKMYVYYDEMTFLDKKHQTETEESIINIRNSGTVIPNITNEDSSAVDVDTRVLNTSNQDIINLESQGNPLPSQKSVTSQNFVKKSKNLRKRKHSDDDDFDKEMMLMFRENAKLFKNDELAFFMSLLPITEKFSTHQKLLFRTEVLKKAMEVGNMSNPYEKNRSDSAHSYYSVDSDSTYYPQGYQNFPGTSGDITQNSVVLYELRPNNSSQNSESVIVSQGYQTICTDTANKEN